MVFLIHGKDSSPEKSNTVQTLNKFLTEKGFNCVCLGYDTSLPSGILAKQFYHSVVNCLINSSDKQTVFIGCSLGGFWSRYLANKFPGSELIMINPSLRFYDDVVTEDRNDTGITVFLSKDDDVVNYEHAYDLYKERGDVRLFEDGGHRFSHLESQLEEIEKIINNTS
jgi:predicted esterase YcpF (UPF0227 family)